MSLAIKLFCQLTRSGKPQVRRLRVPENCSLTDLLALIPHQVPDLAGLHFSLQYTDDEGDNITFALEAEWLECLAVNAGKPVLRLSLVPSKKEKAKEPQEVKPPVPELRPAPRCVLPSVPKTLPAPLLPAQSEVPARPGDVVEMEDDNSSIASSPCSGPAHGLEGFPSSDYELVNEAAAPTPDASLEPNPRELAQAASGEEESSSSPASMWTTSQIPKQAAQAAFAAFSAVTRFASFKPQTPADSGPTHTGAQTPSPGQSAQ